MEDSMIPFLMYHCQQYWLMPMLPSTSSGLEISRETLASDQFVKSFLASITKYSINVNPKV
jgi:hypothetical protein